MNGEAQFKRPAYHMPNLIHISFIISSTKPDVGFKRRTVNLSKLIAGNEYSFTNTYVVFCHLRKRELIS